MANAVINANLTVINDYLSRRPSLTVGQTAVGSWLVADDDIEICALVVVRYMLEHNYKSIGNLHLHTHEPHDGQSYTLLGTRYFSDMHDKHCDKHCGCAENTQGQLGEI